MTIVLRDVTSRANFAHATRILLCMASKSRKTWHGAWRRHSRSPSSLRVAILKIVERNPSIELFELVQQLRGRGTRIDRYGNNLVTKFWREARNDVCSGTNGVDVHGS